MNWTVISTLVLGLAWFAALNIVGSSAAWGVADGLLAARAGRRGGALLAIRLFPAAISVLFVVALFLPAHWRFEPADAQESFGVVLYGLSALGAALVLRSAARVASVARAAPRAAGFRRSMVRPGCTKSRGSPASRSPGCSARAFWSAPRREAR